MGRRARSTVLLLLAAAALAGCGGSPRFDNGRGPMGPERIPLETGAPLASAVTTAPGTPVDGVHCQPVEQLAYHIHVHVQVFVDGRPRQLPGGIGLLGALAEKTPHGVFYQAVRCYYWLHTHASDGIIHIESPFTALYTLGEFFDIWRQPLSSNVVASAHGKVTAFLDGRRWTGSPRSIRLHPHARIQLDVGSPVVPPQQASFDHSGL